MMKLFLSEPFFQTSVCPGKYHLMYCSRNSAVHHGLTLYSFVSHSFSLTVQGVDLQVHSTSIALHVVYHIRIK